MFVCGTEECVACNACINICPKKCITYKIDAFEKSSAYINPEECIHCNLCKKTCPVLEIPKGNKSSECYSAWSLNPDVRSVSASGGIATEMYRYAYEHNMSFAGVKINKEYEAVYSLEKDNWKKFSNSKYVYSNTDNIYEEIRKKLKSGEAILFVGLPCQIAGLNNYLDINKCTTDKVVTADLICHGGTRPKYLKDHIKCIAKNKSEEITDVYFRDPEFKTYTFTFSLRSDKKLIYSKKVYRNDSYQVGYHSGIAYRENCYHCKFARDSRMGDVTLSDFAGVGTIEKCNYDNRKVSCILVNTEKGKNYIEKLKQEGYIFLENRPIEEEYNTEARLFSPTPISQERIKFKEMYSNGKSFDKSIKIAARNRIMKNEIKHFLHVDLLKRIGSKIIPASLKKYIKIILKLG